MIGKNLKKKNATIALNVLYAEKEKIYPAYVSKHKLKSRKKSYFFKRKKIALSCS